jgi:hypothetical protein
MMTLIAVAVVTQPVPFHWGGDCRSEGHCTTEVEENPGRDDVITTCTPESSGDVESAPQCRLTVEPGTTAKEES